MESPYEATWESLARYRVPEWYQDAKLGIFIHWGVYSVPAFDNEWYPRNMYRRGSRAYRHHQARWGNQASFGYKDFIPMFRGEKFDADGVGVAVPARGRALRRPSGGASRRLRHVRLLVLALDGGSHGSEAGRDRRDRGGGSARRAGVRRIQSPRRTLVVLQRRAADRVGRARQQLRRSVWSGDAGPDSWVDTDEWHSTDWKPRPDGKYLEDWLARNCELVDKYQPQVVYFDWWVEQTVFAPYLQRFAAYYYNRGREWNRGVAIDYKNIAFPEGAAVLDVERGQLSDIRPLFWQTCTSVARNSWGYTDEQNYKSAAYILHDLIDVVSKNGTMLLNVGPRADGSIPEPERDLLLEIGGWLAVNGEAIYGTRPWKIYGEGPTQIAAGAFQDSQSHPYTAHDFRFTTKGDTLYAIALAMPDNHELVIESLGSNSVLYPTGIQTVKLVGTDSPLQWSRGTEGLWVRLPEAIEDSPAVTLKING